MIPFADLSARATQNPMTVGGLLLFQNEELSPPSFRQIA